jgi:hypothetical protein
VPGAVVTPRPSWPVATQSPGSHSPTSGSLSGVAGRKPVHVRSARSRARPGRYSCARRSIRAQSGRLIDESNPTSSREEPTRSCPVLRGWTLNATDSAVSVCALFR